MIKNIFLIITLFSVSLTLAALSSPSLEHKANEITILINEKTVTLQYAIDNELLKDGVNLGSKTITPTPTGKYGHNASSVNIYLGKSNNYPKEGEIKLQEAINQGKSLCREQDSTSNWIPSIFGHKSSNVIISIDGENMNLQDAINSAKFCNHKWETTGWSSCSQGSCGTMTAWCKRSDGKTVKNSMCPGGYPGGTSYCYSWAAGAWHDNTLITWCNTQHPTCYSVRKTIGYNKRDVWCQRCDGVHVAGSYCGGGKPSNTRSCSPRSCSSGSVLCTEAHRQGYISDELYQLDEKFAKKHINETTMIGYHSWAKPLVRIMRKSPEISNAVIPLVIEWTKHMAHTMDPEKEDSKIGEIFADTGTPACNELGILLSQDGYSITNEYEFEDEFIEKLFLKYIKKEKFSKDKLSKENTKEEFEKDMENLFSEIKDFYKNTKSN